MNPGRLKASLNNGVAHFGPAPAAMTLPLSAVLTYSVTSPVSEKPSVRDVALKGFLMRDTSNPDTNRPAR